VQPQTAESWWGSLGVLGKESLGWASCQDIRCASGAWVGPEDALVTAVFLGLGQRAHVGPSKAKAEGVGMRGGHKEAVLPRIPGAPKALCPQSCRVQYSYGP
jgi:hypothetical protein